MDTYKYSSQLTDSIRAYLISQDHYRTGALDASIETVITIQGGKPVIKVKANHYLQYLDDGRVLNDFMRLNSTKAVLSAMTKAFLLERMFKKTKN